MMRRHAKLFYFMVDNWPAFVVLGIVGAIVYLIYSAITWNG